MSTITNLLKKIKTIVNAEAASEINENESIQTLFRIADEQQRIAAGMTEDDYIAIFGNTITPEQIQEMLELTKNAESIYTILTKLESDYKELTIEG